MIDVTALLQILGMLAMTVTFGYWGGQVHSMLKALERSIADHEERLRQLELKEART